MIISILLALTYALLSAFAGFLSNKNIKEQGYKNTVFYTSFLSIFIFAFPAALNWQFKLTLENIIIIILFSCISAYSYFIYFWIISQTGSYKILVLEKIYLFSTFSFECILGLTSYTNYKFLSIIIFSVALYFFIKATNKNKNNSDKISLKVMIAFMFTIINWSIVPNLIKVYFIKGDFNVPTYAFLNIIILTLIYFITLKPNIIINLRKTKSYIFLSLNESICSFLYGYAIIFGSVYVVSVFISLDVVIGALISTIILKDKIAFKQWISIIFILASIVLIVV